VRRGAAALSRLAPPGAGRYVSVMFLGHLAVGLAAKRAAPRAGLGPLVAAPILLDLLWPIFLLAGLEVVRVDPGNTAVTPLDFVSYPWSHSLLMAFLWAALLAGAHAARTRDAVGAGVLAGGVVSHWVLDVASHRPDMPLWPGGPRLGLGLWNSVPATVLAEALLFAGGVGLYLATTRARDRTGALALAGFVAFAAAIYAGNLLGPPPPGPKAIAWVSLAQWLWVPWAAWIDRHRGLRHPLAGGALVA
jgi:membrane-bound metal-dependent hydrolase YbcI (DUF457 family)